MLLYFAFVLPLWQLLKLASYGLEKVELGDLMSPVAGSLSMALLAGLVILAAALFFCDFGIQIWIWGVKNQCVGPKNDFQAKKRRLRLF